jgi:hypothetical protein
VNQHNGNVILYFYLGFHLNFLVAGTFSVYFLVLTYRILIFKGREDKI